MIVTVRQAVLEKPRAAILRCQIAERHRQDARQPTFDLIQLPVALRQNGGQSFRIEPDTEMHKTIDALADGATYSCHAYIAITQEAPPRRGCGLDGADARLRQPR